MANMEIIPESPQVSVVCAWYNRADHIRDTIDALLAQDFPSFEIIIVNDGSPDPRVREILDKFNDPRLKVIHQKNEGFTRAIKRAVEEARGQFIAIHGSGDVSCPSRLRLQYEAFQRMPEAAIVGCHYVKRNLSSGSTEVLQPWDIPCSKTTGRLFVKHGMSQGELMYRRSAYEAAGGYRDFFNVGQGTDLWFRMLDHGSFHSVPEVLYEQRIFDDGVSVNYRKIFHRILLHGAMRDERRARSQGHVSDHDGNGRHIPLYLASRRSLSLRYLLVMLMCYVLDPNEAPYYRRIAIANSSPAISWACWLFGFLPFKSTIAKILVRRFSGYRRFITDAGRG